VIAKEAAAQRISPTFSDAVEAKDHAILGARIMNARDRYTFIELSHQELRNPLKQHS
jgi:hypothetical protein